MDREEFFIQQMAYCHDKSRKDGFIHCGDCVNKWRCGWIDLFGDCAMEYCENFTHIEDTYDGGALNE